MSFKKPLFIQNINPRAIFTILLWLILAWILSRPLKGIGGFAYHSLGRASNSIFQSIIQSKTKASELIQSKKIIKEQSKTISLLEVKTSYLQEQVKQAENLKSFLNLKKQISYHTVFAMVIGRSADNWHKQIILDKGVNFNIMQGGSVLTKNGVVGQLVEVGKDTSVVQLISDPSYKLGCKISNKNIIGILSGKTNSVGLIEFIPVGSDIKSGDLVITSGIGTGGLLPTYPSGHPIGKIIKVSKKRKASDLYIEVKLSEDLNTLSDVLVFSPS